MDLHLLIKIIHMSSLILLVIAILARATTLFRGVEDGQPSTQGRPVLIALQHLAFTLIIGTGLILLVIKQFQVQPWFYAKIVLVIVMLSSLLKAYRADTTILLAQRRAGVVISCIALIALVALVCIKPTFG